MNGNLAEFTMAELLQLFALAESTGSLQIDTPAGKSRVLLESGRIAGIGIDEFDVHAEIVKCEMLPAEAGASLKSLKPHPMTPGLSFIVRNLVEPGRWDLFSRRCVEQQIYPFLSATEGQFEATIGRLGYVPMSVSLSVQQLVLDGSRWESEIEEHLEEGYRATTRVMRAESPPQTSRFTALEWLIWSATDRPQSIGRIARRLGVPDLEAIGTARRLLSGGWLQRATSI